MLTLIHSRGLTFIEGRLYVLESSGFHVIFVCQLCDILSFHQEKVSYTMCDIIVFHKLTLMQSKCISDC
jgi:hypothetical protein